MRAPVPQLALLGHFGVCLVGFRWCSFPYQHTSDLSFCASVVSLDDSVGCCFRVWCPPFGPDVDHVSFVVERRAGWPPPVGTVGWRRGRSARCPVSSPGVDHVTVGGTVSEAAEFKCLDVLLEFPL